MHMTTLYFMIIIIATFKQSYMGTVKDLPQLKAVIEHHFQFEHYQFSIKKKCGTENCNIYQLPLLPQGIFKPVHMLSNPPGEEYYTYLLKRCLALLPPQNQATRNSVF